MPSYVLRTVAGDVKYSLSRRRTGGPWHYYFHARGARFRESAHTDDLATAKATTERAIFAALQTEARAASQSSTLQSLIDATLQARWPALPPAGKKPRGYLDAKERLNAFAAWAGTGFKLTALSCEDAAARINGYLDARRKAGMGDQTRKNDRAVLHRFCSWLMERRYAQWPANPCARQFVPAPRVKRSPKPAAVKDAVQALMVAARGHRLYPALVLMQSGFRPAGIPRVRWDDLEFGAVPRVRVTEKSQTRHIPLSPWAARELKAWRAAHPETAKVWPLAETMLHRDLQRLRERERIPAVTHGALRRLTYTRLYQAGVSPQLAAKIMGNSVAVAIRHYVDVDALDASRAVESLSPEWADLSTSTKPPHATLKSTRKKRGK